MKLKRILAALLASSLISMSTAAFTPYMPESEAKAETEANKEAAAEEKDQAASDESIPAPAIKPKDISYKLFEKVLKTYTQYHLYDFTEEEVLRKFFIDFLNENPEYVEIFLDYLLGTMDPYSAYYKPSSGFLETQSEMKGFGFTIKDGKDGITIEEIVKGSNAEDAGFMPGDRFVSIAGLDVEKQTLDVVTAILATPSNYIAKNEEETVQTETADSTVPKEQKSEKIEIIVDRNGEKITINIAKGPVYISEISSYVAENNGKPTAFIEISSFLGDETDKEFVELIKKYSDEGIRCFTIDLRNNGGGSLDYALTMAETFIEKDDIICYYNDKTLEKPTPIYSTTEKVETDSITILVNEKSASASELFTSILRDKGLAKVVGKKTYGKSLGQTVYTLVTGGYITVTTYQMLNTNLESYDGIGIYPDISIEDVEMCYTLPTLGIFNHQNATEIKEGQYSDAAQALEDRMVIMGILRKEFADGIFDDITRTALYVYQIEHKLEATGFVTSETVSRITKTINAYKSHTYYDDTQYDVAMIIHHSFSQGKRLANEKEKLRKEQSQLIAERDAALEAAYDAAHPVTEKENTTQENN